MLRPGPRREAPAWSREARRRNPDPWLLLCQRGDPTAAAENFTFAKTPL